MEKTPMSPHEQLALFENRKPTWAERFWQATDLPTRSKVLSILATIANASLQPNSAERCAEPCAEERADEF